MKRLLTLTTLALLFTCNSYAHALWIDANPTGKKGEKQEARIYYGEYSENKPEKVNDWYSDVKEFSVWLVIPGKEKVKLSATAAEDHFITSFIPEQDGYYTLLVSHDAKDLGGKTKYQFNASAIVAVGKAPGAVKTENSNPLKFTVEGSKINKTATINALFNDAASNKFEVTVFSPKGWTKQIKGSEMGKAEFIPEWPGKYMIEISRKDDEKGIHHDKPFEAVWRCATYLVEVK